MIIFVLLGIQTKLTCTHILKMEHHRKVYQKWIEQLAATKMTHTWIERDEIELHVPG